jgi:hypothetical protein
VRYRLLRFFFFPARSDAACSDGTMRDLHALAAPSTPAYLTVWWRGGGTLAARRQSSDNGSRRAATVPSGKGPLENDADQAVLALLDPVLRNGRAKHVAQQRLTAVGV